MFGFNSKYFQFLYFYFVINLILIGAEDCKPAQPDTPVPHDEIEYTGSQDSAAEIHTVGTWINGRLVKGHYILVSQPSRMVSVLEPGGPGGCTTHNRSTVLERPCLVAVNAGFFNTRTGACLGNIISNGEKIQDNGGILNAHFGIKKNGNLFFGYLASGAAIPEEFLQLVGGVGWIRSNGTTYLNTSLDLECAATQETGSLDRFYSVRSARTAVGSDKEGRMVILQIDGKTDVDGVTLWEMDQLLAKLGVESAINLDGGGSATFALNSSLANYPSDPCSGNEKDAIFRCPRKVSTVLCVHHPSAISPSPPPIIKDGEARVSPIYKWGFVAMCILCILSLLGNLMWVRRRDSDRTSRLSNTQHSDVIYVPVMQEP